MKIMSKIVLTAMMFSSITAFGEDFGSDIDDLDMLSSDKVLLNNVENELRRRGPSLAHGRLFLDDALAKLKNGTLTNPDIRDESAWGNTPLMWAVALRDIDAVEYLCAHGADVNATNDEDATPFSLLWIVCLDAAESIPSCLDLNGSDMVSIATLLANNGLDFYKKISFDNYRITPMMFVMIFLSDEVLHDGKISAFSRAMMETLRKNHVPFIKKNILNELEFGENNFPSRHLLIDENSLIRGMIKLLDFLDNGFKTAEN